MGSASAPWSSSLRSSRATLRLPTWVPSCREISAPPPGPLTAPVTLPSSCPPPCPSLPACWWRRPTSTAAPSPPAECAANQERKAQNQTQVEPQAAQALKHPALFFSFRIKIIGQKKKKKKKKKKS